MPGSREESLRTAYHGVVRSALTAVAGVALILSTGGRPRPPARPPGHLVHYLWERPGQVSLNGTAPARIAFLAADARLAGADSVGWRTLAPPAASESVRDRLQLVAVVRIDSDQSNPASFSDVQTERLATQIASLAANSRIEGVQLDFDATRSQRAFYRRLLVDVRRRLPEGKRLAMTALASWCAGDRWTDDLPVDERIPMLYNLGGEQPDIEQALRDEGIGWSPACSSSAAIWPGHSPGAVARFGTVYLFEPRGWDDRRLSEARREGLAWLRSHPD